MVVVNTQPRIWAVVPVKGVAAAKQRLASRYSPRFRQALAAAMSEDVVAALAAVPELAGLAIVSADPAVAAMAARHGARIVAEGALGGHTAAVAAGIRGVSAQADAVLTVPGDIPCVTADEISELLRRHPRRGPAFTIAPAHDRRGSNAILMTPPGAVPLAFGDDSFLPHLAAARAAGIEPGIVALPGLSLDVDEPADLDRILERLGPGRTRRCLEANGLLRPVETV